MEEEIQTETTNNLDRAKETAERIEKANKELKELLDRQEQMKVSAMLDGKSEAGEPSVEISPEELKKQSAQNFFAGSEIEDALKKYG